jgi:uncharacterized cupredoxin-like copper-binding protein
MKPRFFSISSLLFLLVVLAACGGAPNNTGMKMGGSSMPSDTARTATGSTMMTTIHVTESEFKIDSSVTSLIPGTTYHFVVKNLGKTAHEFMIMSKSEGVMSDMSMGDMDHQALARIETIAPGETKTVDYTFPASAAGSHPEFACYLPGHYEAGMKLAVAVKA